jgi:hypothetical protein
MGDAIVVNIDCIGREERIGAIMALGAANLLLMTCRTSDERD